ncbi:hypothetical protein AC1031_018279 [Aphanomyces cochlioides]|nr:hypothetical protein AC1031_018279 [Aphanomyces cochlioides]
MAWSTAVWLVAAVAVVYFSVLESEERTGKLHERAREVMEDVREVQEAIKIAPLNLTLVNDLKEKDVKWQDEWKKMLELEETNQLAIATHWADTKRKMLESVAAKHEEIDTVRQNERNILDQLQAWKDVRAAIATTSAQIETLKAKIHARKMHRAEMREQAIARGQALLQHQRDREDYERHLLDEAQTAREVTAQRRYWLTSLAVAGALVAFGVIMIALDRTRKQLKSA